MNEMEKKRKSDITAYVQDIQNRISIAVAIAVLKSKPECVSTHEHVEELQRKVLKEWQKEKTPGAFEDKLLFHQLNRVAHDVAEVLPDSPTVEGDGSPGTAEFLVEVTSPPLPIPDDAAVEKHGILFKSLVGLKFATETRKTVQFKKVQEFIAEAKECRDKKSPKTNYPGTSSPKKSQVSEDSGVATSAGYPTRGPDSVSTSLFKSITHSADTEALICKASRSLLNYVRFAVFHSPFDSHYNWDGSLLQKTCNILAGALTDTHCRAAVTTFLETSLDRIWTTDDELKSFAIQHQLLILSTLCQVSDVCSSVLNNIMIKCEEFVVKFSVAEPPSPSCVHQIEILPHFLFFAEILLSRWMCKVGERLRNSSDGQAGRLPGSANDLWRLRTNDGDRALDKSEILTSYWRETLQKLSVSCVEANPLLNSHLLKTLTALDGQLNSEPFDCDANSFFGSFKS